MRKGAGIAGEPPQMTARQQQRQQYLKTHPNAGQRPQGAPMQQRPQGQGPQPGGMPLQPMPQGFNPGQFQPMPRGGAGMYPPMQQQGGDMAAQVGQYFGGMGGQQQPAPGPWKEGWKTEGSMRGPQQGGGAAQQMQGMAPQFQDMMYRYPQGQGPQWGGQGGIQNTMYMQGQQQPMQRQGWAGMGTAAPQNAIGQQLYNQKMNRGGY